jgi:uncharacterized protein YukE
MNDEEFHDRLRRLVHPTEEILEAIQQAKEEIMAAIDDLTTATAGLQTAVQGVSDRVAALEAAHGSQDPAIQAATTAVQGATDTLNGIAPNPVAAAFQVKVSGEAFTDYQNRVAAWNADPANTANQVVALDEATWTALPVG